MLATDRRINLFSLNILAALLASATTCSAAAEREKSPEAGAGAIEYADIGSVHKDGELVTEPRHASQVVRRIWMNIRTSEDRQSFKESIARMQNRKPVYLSYTVTADQSDIEDNIRAYLNTLSKIELADQSDYANGEVLVKARKGKPVLIRNIEADLNVDDEVLALLEKVRLLNHMVKDGIFNHSDYESYKSSLIANAVSKGYLKAKLVSSRVKLYPEENAADIFITFDGGPRYKISRIEFHGFEESHDMARKLTPIKEGEYYDTEKISKMNHNLYESGYFKTADIQTKKDDIVDDQVPLKVELARRPYATLDAGIGVSTDEGVRLQLFGKMPWLNSKGHSFNSFMKVSQVNQYIHGDYIIPRNDPLRDFYVISPHFEHKDNNDTLYDSVVMTLAYVTKTHGRWERKYFLEYGYDDFEQGGEHGNASLLMPGVQLSTSDMEENTMDPSWGYRFTVTGKTSFCHRQRTPVW